MASERRVCVAVVAGILLTATGCDSGARRPEVEATTPSSSPTPARHTASTVGLPPEIPWWSQGRLHVYDGVLRTTMRQVVSRGGTTIIGRSTQHGSRWMILRERGPVELFSTRSLGVRPVVSANGRYAGWATYDDVESYGDLEAETAFTITAYDVGQGRETGSTVIDSHTTCCDAGGLVYVAGIDDDGAVILAHDADHAWVWRPGHEPVELTGAIEPPRMAGVDQWPGGVSWTTGDGSDDPAAYGRVSVTGVVTRVGRVPQSQGGLWSADGTSYVVTPFSRSGSSRPVVWRDGHRQVLRAPRGARPLAWESHGGVLLVQGDLDAPRIRVVRCRVTGGSCEQAGPVLHQAYLPGAFGL